MHDAVGPAGQRLVEVAAALRWNGLAVVDGAKQLEVVVRNGNGDWEADHLLDLFRRNGIGRGGSIDDHAQFAHGRLGERKVLHQAGQVAQRGDVVCRNDVNLVELVDDGGLE